MVISDAVKFVKPLIVAARDDGETGHGELRIQPAFVIGHGYEPVAVWFGTAGDDVAADVEREAYTSAPLHRLRRPARGVALCDCAEIEAESGICEADRGAFYLNKLKSRVLRRLFQAFHIGQPVR